MILSSYSCKSSISRCHMINNILPCSCSTIMMKTGKQHKSADEKYKQKKGKIKRVDRFTNNRSLLIRWALKHWH